MKTRRPACPESVGHDLASRPNHAAGDPGCGRADLVPILIFLRREIDQSATVLGDLADRISQALSALAAANGRDGHASILAEAAIALQNEDRVQQRLRDLAAALAVLERAAGDDAAMAGGGLHRAVIESLRLEETSIAFAAATGMEGAVHQPSEKAEAPSIGDIDLF